MEYTNILPKTHSYKTSLKLSKLSKDSSIWVHFKALYKTDNYFWIMFLHKKNTYSCHLALQGYLGFATSKTAVFLVSLCVLGIARFSQTKPQLALVHLQYFRWLLQQSKFHAVCRKAVANSWLELGAANKISP